MKIISGSNSQPLPNEKAVLITGIVAVLSVCCTGGIISIGAGILGLIYVHKDLHLFAENPHLYSESSRKNIQNGRILCIFGLAMGLFIISLLLFELITGTWWILNWVTGKWNNVF